MAGKRPYSPDPQTLVPDEMRLIRVVGGLLCFVMLACADLKAVMALSEAIQAEYHMQPHVEIFNGSHLTLTFEKDAIAELKLSDEDRASFARKVAGFALSHYRSGTALEDVTISFQSVSSAGPITVTRTDAPFTFTASELR